MKGDSTCHIPNRAYRDNYDRIFKPEGPKPDHAVLLPPRYYPEEGPLGPADDEDEGGCV
jgi:hypothetical protein